MCIWISCYISLVISEHYDFRAILNSAVFLNLQELQNKFHSHMWVSSCLKRSIHQVWVWSTPDVGSISGWCNGAQDPMQMVTAEGRLDPECERSPIRTTVFCLHDAGCSPIYIQSHCVTISNLHCIANLRYEQELICIVFFQEDRDCKNNKCNIWAISNKKHSKLFFGPFTLPGTIVADPTSSASGLLSALKLKNSEGDPIVHPDGRQNTVPQSETAQGIQIKR